MPVEVSTALCFILSSNNTTTFKVSLNFKTFSQVVFDISGAYSQKKKNQGGKREESLYLEENPLVAVVLQFSALLHIRITWGF